MKEANIQDKPIIEIDTLKEFRDITNQITAKKKFKYLKLTKLMKMN